MMMNTVSTYFLNVLEGDGLLFADSHCVSCMMNHLCITSLSSNQ